MISQSELKKLIHYNPETGIFTWIVNGLNRRKGREAGNVCPFHGYVRIGINRKLYKAQHLAYLYMTGEYAENVDHRNGIRHDNRWRNISNCLEGKNYGATWWYDSSHSSFFLSIAFRMVSSLRIQATSATFLAFPAASRRT